MTSVLDVLLDETDCTFKATTCTLAKIKFKRLLKKHSGYTEYGDVLLRSAKDLENEVEYDKYLAWLSNPNSIVGDRNPDPSITGEVLPKMSERPEFLKSSGKTVVIDKESVKNMTNAVFIHIKQENTLEDISEEKFCEEEKIFES